MDGLIYVIDELGRGLATLKAENARLAQENAALREQVAEASQPEDPHSP